MFGKGIIKTLRRIPDAVAVDRRLRRRQFARIGRAIRIDNIHTLSCAIFYFIGTSMSESKRCKRRKSLTATSKFSAIFLSIHTGIARCEVCVYWALGALRYNVDYPPDRSAIIKR